MSEPKTKPLRKHAPRIEDNADASGYEIDVKRFYFPKTLVAQCPKCGAGYRHNFAGEYLSYPPIGEPIEHTCYCLECEHEWPVRLQLDISLRVVS